MSKLELVHPSRESAPETAPKPGPAPGISESVLDEVRSGRLEGRSAEQILEWGFDRFAPRIALSASFGSPEGMVIFDLMHRTDPARTRVFTIDTGRLAQETYNLMDRVRDRYDAKVEVFFPKADPVEAMVSDHGLNLFYESVEKRQMCCGIRRVEPLERALHDLDAWITGLRPAQGPTRENVRAVEIDELHGGRVKLNPLAAWSRDQGMDYVQRNAVPINALHAEGYPSVGCVSCTRAVRPGENERAGRWWWAQEESRECGMHVEYEEGGSGI